MIDQYARTELDREDGLKRLKDSSVMVFGVGGGGIPLHRSPGKKRGGAG